MCTRTYTQGEAHTHHSQWAVSISERLISESTSPNKDVTHLKPVIVSDFTTDLKPAAYLTKDYQDFVTNMAPGYIFLTVSIILII